MAKVFDSAQRKAIEIPVNAVVSAGAGSGKTSVLSARFSHLALDEPYNYDVEQILTLTFTKKATTEMTSRIYKTLKAKNPDKAKEFYKANIHTIDSYCSSIAKIGAHFYGLRPDFTVDNDALKEKIQALAFPFILKNRDNKAIRILSNVKSLSDIATDLFVSVAIENSTIAEPIDFAETLRKQKNEVRAQWSASSAKAIETVSQLRSCIMNFSDKTTSKFFDAIRKKALTAQIADATEISDEIFESSDCAALQPFMDSLLSMIDLKSRLPGKCGEQLTEIKNIFSELRDITIPLLVSLVNFVHGYETMESLVPLMQEFQSTANDFKRTAGIVSFSDVSSMARCILRDYPEIRQVEKEKYKAIMIDEFQDNNSLQRDLLFMLAEKIEFKGRVGVPSANDLEPNKLFFVGDEKQSIYRFRGADVSVFRSLSDDNHFADGRLRLETNYRSSPSLVAAFNSIFGGDVYPPRESDLNGTLPAVFFTDKTKEEGTPNYEAIYHSVSCPKQARGASDIPENETELYSPKIHVALYDKTQETGDDMFSKEKAEARWVVQKIIELTEKDEQGVQKYKPSDIAILFRSYKPQPLFERALLDAGVPYTTEVTTGFFNDGPTNDIFSFLRAIAYPSDTLAYSEILRSPFVNLQMDEAAAILAENAEPFRADAAKILTAGGAARYESAKKMYEDLSAKVLTDGIAKAVSALWYEYGYRYETMWNKKVSAYQTMYDRIFELARLAEKKTMSLASFVDSARTYADESERLDGMDIPLEQGEGVRLMTIFKSKGLEFPVVFVCRIDGKAQIERNDSPIYFDKEFGVSVNTPPCPLYADEKTKRDNYFYNRMKERESAEASAELRRIVYVAMTRAEKEIYLTGTYTPENSETPGIVKNGEDYSLANNGRGKKFPLTPLNILSPALNYHARKESLAGAPFTFETIPPTSRKSAAARNDRANDAKSKAEFAKAARPLYENAATISREKIPSLYVAPSHLCESDETRETPRGEIAPFMEINEIVAASIPKRRDENGAALPPRFSFENFGTIAHIYMEAALDKTEPVIPTKEIAGLENSAKKLALVKSACEKMRDDFINSPLGREAARASWRKTEYEFKSRVNERIIRGTIDLAFKGTDALTIVDYKTNQTIRPEIYFAQLACYRAALGRMLCADPREIKCFLYYLRFSRAVDATEGAAAVDVESAMESLA